MCVQPFAETMLVSRRKIRIPARKIAGTLFLPDLFFAATVIAILSRNSVQPRDQIIAGQTAGSAVRIAGMGPAKRLPGNRVILAG